MQPQIIYGESFADYQAHEKEYLTSHALADFRRSPYLYYQRVNGFVSTPQNPALLIGAAAHALILEGWEALSQRFAIETPINPATGEPYSPRTKAYRDWAAEQKKPVISRDDVALLLKMQKSVHGHMQAKFLLDQIKPEVVVRGTYWCAPCQARLDGLAPQHSIVELKTCKQLEWFEDDIRAYGYMYQLAFYWALVQAATEASYPVWLIAVEKKYPHRVGVWRIADHALQLADTENRRTIEKWVACKRTNQWPTGFEDVKVFDWL